MNWIKLKDLGKRTQSDVVLKNKAFKLLTIHDIMVKKENYQVCFINFWTRNLKDPV